ncbi:helix-turn-helix domain-containing protein [Bradyrhizobium sp. ISRA443]|uniref:IclR family transcriptional regulator n=1 Tax=unclassified Bradyrhizobium TaxID=2631580 RepID=UPI00247A4441|nr:MULTISPECIES: helix-turn-helix domain-containing protein [unclassified Bradyrhizobium]WGR99082.1 helix-turn-helix domain-containing protein [Bradyrhizobium sp. ISRA436]WGS05973.1 helix-turn-helix domain-containing protein [Bradyrhizobium sp. ISRA437]WGS12859.1 helix-turn-helix domain-containing protein [Bradyrhizobium sp. ISRA443]
MAKKDVASAGPAAGPRSFDGAGDTSRDLPKMENSVKSARRVFDVLEFFEEHQRAASAIEVANALKFPQSSTSALMRTMTAFGYLHYDTSRRTYIPTPRVSMLGHWLSPALFTKGRLINLMEDLSAKTGETIMVAVRNGLTAQYVHVIQAKLPMRLYVKSGTLRPLARSGSGYALLSAYPDREVRRLVRLINDNETQPDRQIDIKALLLELKKVRAKGHAFSLGLVTPGAGVVAMNLPPIAESNEPLVLCVAGLTDALVAQETELAELMRKAIQFHLAD